MSHASERRRREWGECGNPAGARRARSRVEQLEEVLEEQDLRKRLRPQAPHDSPDRGFLAREARARGGEPPRSSERGIPSPSATMATVVTDGHASPRSSMPTKFRWSPARRASSSCERPCAHRLGAGALAALRIPADRVSALAPAGSFLFARLSMDEGAAGEGFLCVAEKRSGARFTEADASFLDLVRVPIATRPRRRRSAGCARGSRCSRRSSTRAGGRSSSRAERRPAAPGR